MVVTVSDPFVSHKCFKAPGDPGKGQLISSEAPKISLRSRGPWGPLLSPGTHSPCLFPHGLLKADFQEKLGTLPLHKLFQVSGGMLSPRDLCGLSEAGI